MATTAQKVFDIAMGLMGEINENTGATDTTDNREYKLRTLFILNTLRGELYPFSDTYRQSIPGKHPVCGMIMDFNTAIDLDDVICETIMPYGLAAYLLLDENPNTAVFFQQKFEELKERLAKRVPAEFESINDVYGIAENGEYSRW